MTLPDAWHASPQALQQYAAGTVTDAIAWSVEIHLPACAQCRARLVSVLSDQDHAELQALRQELRVAARPDRAPLSVRAPVRAALRGVLGPWWAWGGLVALAFTAVTLLGLAPVPPAGLLTSWAAALAPLVPLAMVATVYAIADGDPAVAATPRSGLELVLTRTLTVLAVAVPTVTLGMVAGGAGGADGVRWLLPGLALCAGALALGSSLGVERACAGLSLLWGAVVVAAAPPVGLGSAAAVIEPTAATNALWLVVLLAAVGAIAVQRDRFDLPGRLS